MNKSKPVLFSSIKVGAAFTPAYPDPDANKVFVKKENGICPLLDKTNQPEKDNFKHGLMRVVYPNEGIFYPLDRVYPVNVPTQILFHYR